MVYLAIYLIGIPIWAACDARFFPWRRESWVAYIWPIFVIVLALLAAHWLLVEGPRKIIRRCRKEPSQ